MESYPTQPTLYRHSKLDFLLTLLGIGTTLFAFSMFVWETFYSHSGIFQHAGLFGKVETLLFVGVVMFLVYGNLVYQFTRHAYFSRRATHSPTPRLELEGWYKRSASWVTILVPAFKEEPGVVYQTLLSAALQDYHHCRIVLLIDDPSHPTARKDQENLTALRALPHHIQELLDSQKAQIDKAYAAFREREQKGLSHFDGEVGHLIHLFQEIQSWFHQQTFSIEGDSHTNRWFVQNILLVHNEQLERRAATLLRHQTSNGEKLSQVIHQEYRFLKALFSCEISSFERKRYRNLSHEPNKAMNLNTYMGLMGNSLFEETGQEGLVLKRSSKKKDTFYIPDAKYVLTLDADSLILPDYTLRLVHFMEQPQQHRVAVAQTPYSAIPDAPNLIERIAGATTDIQYITHQGFTQYEGTYWVGANALLRKSALKEIARKSGDPNLPTIKFIQDRTVIEDTESSIDLIVRGQGYFILKCNFIDNKE